MSERAGPPACTEGDRTADERTHAGASPDSAWATIAPPNGGGDPTPPAEPEAIHIPGYEILGPLGKGGMGVVYRARHLLLGREVALKVLAPELTGDETALHRFLREIVALGRLGLDHPNLVRAMDAGEAAGRHFLAMEYLDGRDLARRVREGGALPVDRACDCVRQAALGLQHVHEKGLVHRDIKPANLFLTAGGLVKVLDLGLAQIHRRDAEVRRRTRAGFAVSELTGQGQFFGTADYMAPEQWDDAGGVDIRADLYGLGCTLFYLLTGEPPFPTSRFPTLAKKWRAHVHEPPPDVRTLRPDVPAGLAGIVSRLLAKRPAQRFATPAELAAALAPYCRPASSSRPRRSRRWLLAGGVLVTLLLAALPLGRRPPAAAPPGGEPIRLGVLFSLTGPMSSIGGPSADAALLAVEEINDRGGLLGRRVEPVLADGGHDYSAFADQAEKLIVEQKVCAILGPASSAGRKTVLPVVERHDHLLLYPMQFEGLEQSPNVVYLGAAPNQQMLPAVDYLIGMERKRRLFVVGSDYVLAHAAAAILRDEVGRRYPEAKVVGEEYVPFGGSDVGAAVRAVAAARPDLVLNSIKGDANVAFFRQLRAAGLRADRTTVLSFCIGENDLRSLRDEANGHYAAWSYFQTVDRPQNDAFVRNFRARFGPQRELSDPMETAYLGVHLWAQAVRAAGSAEPAQVRRTLRGQTFDAPEGKVRIDPDNGYTWRVMRLGRIRGGGQFEVVWSTEVPQRPEPYPSGRPPAAWQKLLQGLYDGWGGRWEAPAR